MPHVMDFYNKREFGFLIYKWQIIYPSLDAPKTSKVYSFSIYIYKAILYYKKINIFITCLKFLFCSVLKCALYKHIRTLFLPVNLSCLRTKKIYPTDKQWRP